MDAGLKNPSYEQELIRMKLLENMKSEHKTLRDEMAMAALQGLNASLASNEDWPCDSRITKMVDNAYKQADAMLKERVK